jgi:apurinic endonuclease APN1
MNINEDVYYGFHIEKKGTFLDTIDFVIKKTPYTCVQLYLSNPRSFSKNNSGIESFILEEDLQKTRELINKFSLKVVAHGSLIYNLCGNENIIQNTCDGLLEELDKMVILGGDGIVVHPGSNENIEKGLVCISKVINFILKKDTKYSKNSSKILGIGNDEFKKRRKIILENSAHEGNKRCWNLQEFSKIFSNLEEEVKDQVFVCIDTAHAFGAGIYDFGIIEDIEKFYKEFEENIGLNRLKLFHLNDSRISVRKGYDAKFGSRKDRHANLGYGYIFDRFSCDRTNSLIYFIEKAVKYKIYIIGEPPSTTNDEELSISEFEDWEYVQHIFRKLIN